MNVVRDSAIVRWRENNVRVLSRDLKGDPGSFFGGRSHSGRTSRSRAPAVAGAVSELDLARANLKASRANYEQVVGRKPGRLVGASARHFGFCPRTCRLRGRVPSGKNPDVVGALYNEQAARYDVNEIAVSCFRRSIWMRAIQIAMPVAVIPARSRPKPVRSYVR